jgi:hypothetical protein
MQDKLEHAHKVRKQFTKVSEECGSLRWKYHEGFIDREELVKRIPYLTAWCNRLHKLYGMEVSWGRPWRRAHISVFSLSVYRKVKSCME